MRTSVLFRIRHILAVLFLVLLASRPAHALWLEVTGESYPVIAPLVINLDGKSPPPGDMRHGLFALPPSSINAADPRLKMQYRADFPLSVTFETAGAVARDHLGAAGALSLTTRIVLIERWWVPQLNAALADFNIEQLAQGRVEPGSSNLRSEWKLRF
jgi:hypothetical protein